MCLSKAYFEKNNSRKLMLEEIASVTVENNTLIFKTIFGEQKAMKASIRQIDFMTHSIFLEKLKE